VWPFDLRLVWYIMSHTHHIHRSSRGSWTVMVNEHSEHTRHNQYCRYTIFKWCLTDRNEVCLFYCWNTDSNILVSFPPSRIIDLEHEMKTLCLSLLRFRIWAYVLGELSFFLRIIPKTMMLILNHQKAAERGGYGGERYEQLEFQKKVAKCYQALCDSSWKVILSFYCNNQTCMVASWFSWKVILSFYCNNQTCIVASWFWCYRLSPSILKPLFNTSFHYPSHLTWALLKLRGSSQAMHISYNYCWLKCLTALILFYNINSLSF